MLLMSLMVVGGLLLLGSLVLLVVCSGINDHVSAPAQPSVGAGSRETVTRAAVYSEVTWGT